MPLFVWAAPLPPQSDFCYKLPDISARVLNDINEKEARLHDKQARISQDILADRNDSDGEKTANRMRWDSIYEQNIAMLKARAENNAQKSAVEKYLAAVADAVNNRRIAINSALQTFRQGVDQAMLARTGIVNVALSGFKTAASEAFSKASADCANSVTGSTVHKNLVTSLKAAKQKFNTDRSAAEKLSISMQALVTARKSATAKALADFKTAMQKARADLKVSFPKAD